MALVFTGCKSRSGGAISAIAKQLRKLNLKPLTEIKIQFDPFDDRVAETRKFLYFLSRPKTLATNITCAVKTEVVCDRSEPTVTCKFETDEKLIFKCSNLTTIDILTLMNKHVSSRVKPVESLSLKVKTKRK